MTITTPLREGLFRETEEGPTLLAARCAKCGHTSYPAPPRCPNCLGEEHQTIELGSEGELHSATIVHMGSQHFQPGYAVGYINLPHGIRVFSQLGVSDGDLPASGATMRLEILPLWQEGDQEILGYRYVPSKTEEKPDA